MERRTRRMSSNTEHFTVLPEIDISRSKFDRPFDHKDTFNCSELVPLYVDEIIPGDTVEMRVAGVIRETTPIYPVMDNSFLDLYSFFVPSRLVWDHFREFWGENRTTHWEQPVEYEIPQITSPSGGWTKGSLADHFGIPTKVSNISISHLPFRAYCQIVNDWFLDENLKDPCMMNKDETTLTGKNKGNDYDYTTDIQLGASCFKAAKYADYFTKALPSAQKHDPVLVPLGQSAPVIASVTKTSIGSIPEGFKNNPLVWQITGSGNARMTTDTETHALMSNGTAIGLSADLSNAVGATVNQLRQAFAVQKFYEKQALYGSRYIEFVRGQFGVTSPDARQQRAEFLGHDKIMINVNQVLQTSATDSTSPQGNTAAYSCTSFNTDLGTHSFTEHGYLMVLGVIRTEHTYQQGIERMWSRKKWSDFYLPVFANLGNMAILNKEIYATGTSADEEAFGYQEAFADYRYKPNLITGAFRSNYTEGSLDSWHYGDYYTEQPILSSEWIDETYVNVDRTLTVQSSVEDQYFADFYFTPTYVRPMPLYSVPGLLDHH